ncbi:hypothetical protein CS022_00770 [Veronia nyctiphanis]|uniref:DUF4401 domain-containing protein n=1 Tax=Veronia nyctiphanis TaxID=1278244 RepID=A0A4Q0Z042_9GAMM|nr:DUF4401 domain-containing protein [Veronia nyctiphanis]RXJ74789.1 hypothetical protein CS022_00770 [Veronia nyctiphanis]
MTPNNPELWHLLNQKGLTAGGLPQNEELASLWYMDAFQAIATWMASLLFIGFVGALFNDALENIFLTIPLSLMMLAGAFSIFKIASQVITTNIGLVLSLTAQVLLAFIINEHVDKSTFDLTYTALALFALQVLLVLTFDNHVHRMMCAFFAACAFAFVMLIHDHYYWVVGPLLMVFCYLKLTEFSSPKWVKIKSAASAGLLAAVLLIQYNLPEMIRVTSQHPFHLSSEILNALALFGTVMMINQRTAMSVKAKAFAFFCA